jgi:hypothetical protein
MPSCRSPCFPSPLIDRICRFPFIRRSDWLQALRLASPRTRDGAHKCSRRRCGRRPMSLSGSEQARKELVNGHERCARLWSPPPPK